MRRRGPVIVLPAPERPAPTYPQYAQLLTDAKAAAAGDHGFVDPVKYRRAQVLPRGYDWRLAVLGHDGGTTGSTVVEMHMRLLADERDLDPPLPQWVIQARQESDARRRELDAARRASDAADQAAWDEVRQRCQVDVDALRNGHTRARGGYAHNLGHVVPSVDALSGTERRPRRHRAGRALCETETRARPLDLSGGQGGPATCRRCLEYTPKIRPAQVPAPPG